MYLITVYEDAHADDPDEVLREGTLLVAMERAIEQARDLPQEGHEYDFAGELLPDDGLFEIFPKPATAPSSSATNSPPTNPTQPISATHQ